MPFSEEYNMSRRGTIATLSLCALLLSISAEAFAQAQPNPLPPPVDRSGSTEGRKKVAMAQAEVKKTEAALTEIVNKLRSNFETGEEWKAASAAQKEAQSEHDNLRKPIIESVKKNPAYVKAEADKRKAEEQLADYRLSRVTGDPVLVAAQKRADAGVEIVRIETEALN